MIIKKIKIDVLILIEHKARELESAVLLQYYFEKKGYSVIVDSIKFHKESVILKYAPKIAVVPWAYSNEEIRLFRNFNCFGNRTLLINMHHEQISNEGSDRFIIPKETATDILHVSWGENFTTKLIQSGCKEENIIQCGNPKLDFFRPPLSGMSANKSSLSKAYNLDTSKKWVVFIANSFHLLNESKINDSIDKGVDILDLINSSIINRNLFLDYAKDYLVNNDDTIFIYRSHPSFAHVDNYSKEITELRDEFENFKCISEGSIRDWLINSDIVLSFHSTAVLEASVANVPFYLFRPQKLENSKDYRLFNDYQYVIRSQADFLKALELHNDFSYSEFRLNCKEFVDLDSNLISCETIVDYVNEYHLLRRSNYNFIRFSVLGYILIVMKSILKKGLFLCSKLSFIKQAMTRKKDIRFFNLFYEGDDYLTAHDISEVMGRIIEILVE